MSLKQSTPFVKNHRSQQRENAQSPDPTSPPAMTARRAEVSTCAAGHIIVVSMQKLRSPRCQRFGPNLCKTLLIAQVVREARKLYQLGADVPVNCSCPQRFRPKQEQLSPSPVAPPVSPPCDKPVIVSTVPVEEQPRRRKHPLPQPRRRKSWTKLDNDDEDNENLPCGSDRLSEFSENCAPSSILADRQGLFVIQTTDAMTPPVKRRRLSSRSNGQQVRKPVAPLPAICVTNTSQSTQFCRDLGKNSLQQQRRRSYSSGKRETLIAAVNLVTPVPVLC